MSAARAEGLQEGIEKGVLEGERKAKLETAQNLKNMGLALEQILAATGLTADDLGQMNKT
ncbi:MAG: hypothetical protein CNLJKLNK_01101 [Holosporales bacterium]